MRFQRKPCQGINDKSGDRRKGTIQVVENVFLQRLILTELVEANVGQIRGQDGTCNMKDNLRMIPDELAHNLSACHYHGSEYLLYLLLD